MNFIFILLGMNIQFLFLFKREWLLSKHIFIKLFFCNSILFGVAYVFESGSLEETKLLVAALKMPVISQLIFLILVLLFRKLLKRNPVDTFWTSDMKLLKDGIFNFVFWFLSTVIPAGLVFSKII